MNSTKTATEEYTVANTALRNLDLPLIYFILKINTDENHAMSVAEIAEQLDFIIPSPTPNDHFFSDRTVRRKLEVIDFLETSNQSIISEVNKLMSIIMGGHIEFREADGIINGRTKVNPKAQKQRRYYFVPILSSGDMNMIYGALQSSRYLSDEEKEYLVERLKPLQTTYNYDWADNANIPGKFGNSINLKRIWNINNLPARPISKKHNSLPVDSSSLLNHIQILHEAIRNDCQVDVVYGIYDSDDNNPHIVGFYPRHDGIPSTINPYALMWNDGEYYLIASHAGHDNPIHYRVDRIISLKPTVIKNKDGLMAYSPRDKRPKSLAPFFTKVKGKTEYFDAIAYANKYPRMLFYKKENTVDCVFECTTTTLQILIDYFGVNLRLGETPISHDESEVDYTGKPQQYLTATVSKVQYENALGFAISHCQSLTLLSPSQMVEDVKKELDNAKSRLM